MTTFALIDRLESPCPGCRQACERICCDRMEAHVPSSVYHSGRSVSDLATEAVMNLSNWPLGVSAVRSLPAGPAPLSREIQREPKSANQHDQIGLR